MLAFCHSLLAWLCTPLLTLKLALELHNDAPSLSSLRDGQTEQFMKKGEGKDMLAWDSFICKTVTKHPKNPKHVWRKEGENRGEGVGFPKAKSEEFLTLKGQPS